MKYEELFSRILLFNQAFLNYDPGIVYTIPFIHQREVIDRHTVDTSGTAEIERGPINIAGIAMAVYATLVDLY